MRHAMNLADFFHRFRDDQEIGRDSTGHRFEVCYDNGQDVGRILQNRRTFPSHAELLYPDNGAAARHSCIHHRQGERSTPSPRDRSLGLCAVPLLPPQPRPIIRLYVRLARPTITLAADSKSVRLVKEHTGSFQRRYFFVLLFAFFACSRSDAATDFCPGVLFLVLSCLLAFFATFVLVVMLISLLNGHHCDGGAIIPLTHKVINFYKRACPQCLRMPHGRQRLRAFLSFLFLSFRGRPAAPFLQHLAGTVQLSGQCFLGRQRRAVLGRQNLVG